MFKKTVLASLIAASAVSVAVAAPAPYVGAGLGIVTNTTSNNGLGNAANFRGVPFNVFAGYGGIVSQDVYLAGELTATLGTGEFSNNGGMKTSYEYGVSIIPGVLINEKVLAFGRAGLVRARFSNAGKITTGEQLGLGLQTNLAQSVDLRGEYDYTVFNSFSNSNGRISSPRQDAVSLSLVYKFD